ADGNAGRLCRRLPADRKLSRDPRLQLLELLRADHRTSGERDFSAEDGNHRPPESRSFPLMSRPALIAAASSLLFGASAPAAAPPYDTPARTAYLIDLSSGALLYTKNPDVRMP